MTEHLPILDALKKKETVFYKPEINQVISIKKKILSKSLEKSAKFKSDTEENPIFFKEFDLGFKYFKNPDDFINNSAPLPKKYKTIIKPEDNTFHVIIGEAGQGKSYTLMKILNDTCNEYKALLEKKNV